MTSSRCPECRTTTGAHKMDCKRPPSTVDKRHMGRTDVEAIGLGFDSTDMFTTDHASSVSYCPPASTPDSGSSCGGGSGE